MKTSSALRVAAAVVLLAVVVHLVGGREIAARLAAIDPAMFVLALLCFLLGQVFNALRWRWLLATVLPAAPPLAYLFALVMVGMFANFLMPSSVGGDVVRAEMVRSVVGGRTHAYFSILVARVLGMCSVVAIGALAMLGAYLTTGWFQWQVVSAGAAVVLLTGAAFAWATRGGLPGALAEWMPARVADVVGRLREALGAYGAYPGVLWRVFGFGIFANVVGTIGVVWILAEGLGLVVPAYFHFVAVPLVMLVTLVPVSINGIGLREGAFAYLYAMAGLGGGAAVSLSLSFTAVLALCSLMGGLFLLLPRHAWPGSPRRGPAMSQDGDPPPGSNGGSHLR